MDEITHSPHPTTESKVKAGSFTENVQDELNRSHIPEHLRIPIPEKSSTHYPAFITRTTQAVNHVCCTYLISPFKKILRILQKRTGLTFWIILAMVIGILIGRFAPEAGVAIKPLGDAFIQMIKIIIVPLVFSVLIIGIAGHGDDIAKVGKLAIKTIIVSRLRS